jgi:hypothetical protein
LQVDTTDYLEDGEVSIQRHFAGRSIDSPSNVKDSFKHRLSARSGHQTFKNMFATQNNKHFFIPEESEIDLSNTELNERE